MKSLQIIILIFTILFSGCAKKQKQVIYEKSSIDNYFSKDEILITKIDSMSDLKKPLKVAIAFVPSREKHYRRVVEESHKMVLASSIKEILIKNSYIKFVTLIPSAYLLENGGLDNLSNIEKMYNVDLIVLLSYNKTFFTKSNAISYKNYKTLMDVYQVSGKKYDLNSMLEAVLVDIKNRKLLSKMVLFQNINTKDMDKNQAESKNFKIISHKLLAKIDDYMAKL